MRVVPISELANYGEDEVIPCVKGKVVSILKPMSGTGDYGDWKLQTIDLEAVAPDRGKIKVVLKDRDDHPLDCKGKVLYFSCTKTDRGVMGVKWKKNKKKNTMEVSVTSTAEISETEPGGAPASNSAPAEKPPADKPQEPAQKPTTPPPENKPAQKVNAKIEVLKKAHLMFICFQAAEYALGKFAESSGSDASDVGFDAITSAASTLYIDAHRDGLHRDLSYTIPEQKPKPEPMPS